MKFSERVVSRETLEGPSRGAITLITYANSYVETGGQFEGSNVLDELQGNVGDVLRMVLVPVRRPAGCHIHAADCLHLLPQPVNGKYIV